MARRYTRDNRGRFSSVGATARGGRLRTASGNKRATQTEKLAGGKPAGTVGRARTGKPKAMKPQQVRDAKLKEIELRRQASAVSSRMGHTNASPSDQAKLHREAGQLRAQADAIGKQLKGQKEPPHVYARGRALTGETMGKYKGQGRFSLYGKDRGLIERPRLASTVRKPRGLALVALTPKPAAKPQAQRKVDYAGAVGQLKAQQAAIRRLRQPQQTFGGHASYGRALDVRTARNTPMQNAQLGIRAARGDYRRAQASAKNPWATSEQRQKAAASLPGLRKKVVKATRAARAFKPQYADETRRRFQASNNK